MNAYPFDEEVIGPRFKVVDGGTAVVPMKNRANLAAHATASARTSGSIACRPQLATGPTCQMHYFEVKISGDPYGFAIGIVAGASTDFGTWFPTDSLRMEFDGCIRSD